MRVVITLLLCVCYKVMAQGGGIKMKIGQDGLNEVISYLLDSALIPYVQNFTVNNLEIKLGATQILVDKLQLQTLEGQHASIDILDGNKVDVTVGFTKLALRANLTRVASNDIIYAPNTVVYFHDCQLRVTFSLGLERNKNGVTLDTCKASIEGFNAEGELGSALEGAYVLGGDSSVASLVEQICPTLENITNDNLDEILSVQDTVSIASKTNGNVAVNMKLVSASTETDFITMKVEVTTGADPFDGKLSFLSSDQKQSGFDAVLLINDELLSKVCEHTIQGSIFKNFAFQKSVNKVAYSIQVNETTIQNRVVSSNEGTSVIWNVTFVVYTSDNCMAYLLTMDSVTPLVFGYNDTLIDIASDTERLHREFKVSHWNKVCKDSAGGLDTSKIVQKELLRETNREFEKRLKGKSFEFKLPKGKWYGFKEPSIESLEGGMIFASALRVGETSQVKIEELKHVYNKHYDTSFTSYMFSDGETVDIEGPKPPVASSTVLTYNICLIVFSIASQLLSLFVHPFDQLQKLD